MSLPSVMTMKNDDAYLHLVQISHLLMEAWRTYGLFYGITTSEIINPLDGRVKVLIDEWDSLRDEISP